MVPPREITAGIKVVMGVVGGVVEATMAAMDMVAVEEVMNIREAVVIEEMKVGGVCARGVCTALPPCVWLPPPLSIVSHCRRKWRQFLQVLRRSSQVQLPSRLCHLPSLP